MIIEDKYSKYFSDKTSVNIRNIVVELSLDSGRIIRRWNSIKACSLEIGVPPSTLGLYLRSSECNDSKLFKNRLFKKEGQKKEIVSRILQHKIMNTFGQNRASYHTYKNSSFPSTKARYSAFVCHVKEIIADKFYTNLHFTELFGVTIKWVKDARKPTANKYIKAKYTAFCNYYNSAILVSSEDMENRFKGGAYNKTSLLDICLPSSILSDQESASIYTMFQRSLECSKGSYLELATRIQYVATKKIKEFKNKSVGLENTNTIYLFLTKGVFKSRRICNYYEIAFNYIINEEMKMKEVITK